MSKPMIFCLLVGRYNFCGTIPQSSGVIVNESYKTQFSLVPPQNTAFLSLVIMLTAGFTGPTQAQHRHYCGTDHMVEQSLNHNPQLKRVQQQLEQFTQHYVRHHQHGNTHKSGQKSAQYIIPTVIHVIHDNTSSSLVSPAQVHDATRIMNRDFLKQNSDTAAVSASFQSLIDAPKVELRLAGKDPQGQCSNGITYTFSNNTNAANNNVKDLISWPTDKYLNVWVVKRISFSAGAFAYYPGTAPQSSYEGIVCTAQQFGSMGLSIGGNFASRTMTHELGHYFNLPHPWGSTNDPGLQSNCNIDDGVSDTPMTIGVSGLSCDTNQVSCGSLDNVENYMDYSSCGRMFTTGQSTRMHAALNSPTASRNNLWTDQNLAQTGTADTSSPCPIKPEAYLIPTNTTSTCQNGYPLVFRAFDLAAHLDSNLHYIWNIEAGSVFQQSPSVVEVYYDTLGDFDLELIIEHKQTNLADTIFLPDYIQVINDSSITFPKITYSLDQSSWPVDSSNSSLSFINETPGGKGFAYSDEATWSGPGCLKIDHQAMEQGDVASFILPAMNFNQNNYSPYMSFRYALAKKASSSNDKLSIYYSLNCGSNWYQLQTFSASDTSWYGSQGIVPNDYVPQTADWRKQDVLISAAAGSDYVLFRFEYTYGGGNNFFIDEIKVGYNPFVSQSPTRPQEKPLLLRAQDLYSARLRFAEPQQIGGMRIFNSAGQRVEGVDMAQQVEGDILLRDYLQKSYAPGLYILQLLDKDGAPLGSYKLIQAR